MNVFLHHSEFASVVSHSTFFCGVFAFISQTTAVKSCANEMKKWAKRNGYDKPRFCEINMAKIVTAAGLMRAMLKKIATVVEIDKEAPLSTFEKQFKKTTVVLILDEVDMLFKQHAGIGETWFKTLVDWAENKELRFSMIGISNCVNDVNSERIRELGHVSENVGFASDIFSMLLTLSFPNLLTFI